MALPNLNSRLKIKPEALPLPQDSTTSAFYGKVTEAARD